MIENMWSGGTYPLSAMSSRLLEQLPATDLSSKRSVHFRDLLGRRVFTYINTSWKHPGIGLPLTLVTCLDDLRYTTSTQKLTLRFFSLCIPLFFTILRVWPEEIVFVEMSINTREGYINFFLVSMISKHHEGSQSCAFV